MIAVIFLPLLIVFHELGHYIIAKKEGIYKGYGFLPNPHIKLARPYNSRWDYLSGFVFSAIPLPSWIFWVGISLWYWYLFMMLSAASLDFLIVIFYGKVKT